MNPVRFVFGVHFHQPVGNFDHVFEEHLRDVYRPLVERLAHRREVYHEPPPPLTAPPPPVDLADRALFVDRVLPGDVALEGYVGGEFETVASWAGDRFHASIARSEHAVELVLRAGSLEKRVSFGPSGELTVSYRWDPAGFPPDAFFCPEISVSGELELDLAPAADVWSFPIATVSRSDRGFEEIVQGYSYTPRWPLRCGEARVRLVQPT